MRPSRTVQSAAMPQKFFVPLKIGQRPFCITSIETPRVCSKYFAARAQFSGRISANADVDVASARAKMNSFILTGRGGSPKRPRATEALLIARAESFINLRGGAEARAPSSSPHPTDVLRIVRSSAWVHNCEKRIRRDREAQRVQSRFFRRRGRPAQPL
jgi:hypothetical protein